jgi:hypothetical protein
MNKVFRILSLLGIILILALIASCGDTGTTGDVQNKWTVNALVAHDANTGQIHSYLALTRDGAGYPGALVTLEAPPADSADPVSLAGAGDGTFRLTFSPRLLRDTTTLKIKSILDQFQFSSQFSVPDSIGLEVVDLPDNRVLSSTQNIQIRWIAPRYAEGYCVIVQPVLTTNLAVGFKTILRPGTYGQDPPYLTSLIPREAFRSTQGEFQPGSYNVWIAAYHDSPINSSDLPFVLPDGFARNIDRTGVTGQIGSLFIGKVVVLTAVAPS